MKKFVFALIGTNAENIIKYFKKIKGVCCVLQTTQMQSN
jgi:hypothetical protein